MADGSGRRKGTKCSVTSHPFASLGLLVRNVHYVQYIRRSQRSESDMYLLQEFFKDLVTLLKNGTLYVSSGRLVAALVKIAEELLAYMMMVIWGFYLAFVAGLFQHISKSAKNNQS
ncbi:hypothetical protein HZH66_013686 [Vespula vulgaris]|uniref:Uncharacterized protein n=1 Tax=Vespula vulgaris TaxID=7454 RepID=A0A834J5N1_VESVU|nr:hypothetical protein HZH66_013686 [Vespula vulgaris]